MQPIVVFVILAVILGGYFYFGQTPEQEEELLKAEIQETLPQAQGSVAIAKPVVKPVVKPAEVKPAEVKPAISINTYITSGPEEGEVIDDENKATFEFKAKVSPEETEGRIIFETKIEGFDEDWKETSSNQRTINFPSGPKEYTFFVRAKIEDAIDPTPAKRTFKINTSLYFGKIKISSVRAQTLSSPPLITLSTYLKKGEEINITGWRIRGRKGIFVVPQGIEKYHPLYASFSSKNLPTKNIVINQSDRIYLSSDSSPLGRNINFQPNKCFGYLANYRDFSIPLPKNCPKPTREEISHLSPCCQEFILRMRTCEIPDYSQNYRVARDSECVDYLNDNFNYGGCFRNYSRDEDFIGKDWNIYMNSNIVVSDDCDTLYLRDQNGLVVDEYSYGHAVCR